MIPRPEDVSAILREIRACKSQSELAACRDAHRDRVKELAVDPSTKPFAYHIANLADLVERDIQLGRA